MNISALLEILKGRSVYDIGAAADMLWINIEDRYAIDIQSPFRVTANGKIVLSNTELYLEQDDIKQSISKCRSLLELPCKIEDIRIAAHNDLHISLSNGGIIETFTNSADGEDEQWRIFERHNDEKPHYAAYPFKICEE